MTLVLDIAMSIQAPRPKNQKGDTSAQNMRIKNKKTKTHFLIYPFYPLKQCVTPSCKSVFVCRKTPLPHLTKHKSQNMYCPQTLRSISFVPPNPIESRGQCDPWLTG